MKLIAKTRLIHRPKIGEPAIIVEPGEAFDVDDKAARVLIEQNEADVAKSATPGTARAPDPAA
jgi:hypothetical protein